MSAAYLDPTAILAQQHIDELRREAARARLARDARQHRRSRRAAARGRTATR